MDNLRLRSESKLRGANVVNPEGEDLGQIKDLAIDLETGGVAYAVLSFGGFLSAGDKLFAIPWEALQIMDDRIVLNVPKERLKEAPGFNSNQWPQHADWSFLNNVYTYYGYDRYDTHRSNRHGAYLERKRKAREGTLLDVVDPKHDGVS